MEGMTGIPKQSVLVPPSALGITSPVITDPSHTATTFAFIKPYSFGQPQFQLFTVDTSTYKSATSGPIIWPGAGPKKIHFAATTATDLQKVMS